MSYKSFFAKEPYASYHGVPAPRWEERLPDMQLWCTEQFGPGGRPYEPSPNPPWFSSMFHFWFKNENHAMLFKLRWNG